MNIDTSKSEYAQVSYAPECAWTEGFFADRAQTCANTTIPHVLSIFDDRESFFHVVENFRIAAGEAEGEFRGNSYGDGDFYKLLEGMIGADFPADMIDAYIRLIAAAQQPDGYLATKQIIGERASNGVRRHGDVNDFEEYNFGHLMTAACAHYRKTGQKTLLAVAEKVCDYLDGMYTRILNDGAAQTAVCPSHYMGLAEMYRATRDEKYKRLLKTAIELRDRVETPTVDNQDYIPLREQRVMLGHAVRATYLYAGVADLYLETGDAALLPTLESCWRNMLDTKLYITGGLGALYTGASPFGDIINAQRVHQAFGYEYQLPNITAYNETCAALGGVFWAARMFAIRPRAEYVDFIERVAYNLAPGAVSISGDKYFYENMLRRAEKADYYLIWPRERTDTFKCFCCPTNIARFWMETGSLMYAQTADSLYTCLYGSGKSRITLAGGARFNVAQSTEYPYDGHISLMFSEMNGKPFTLRLRVPGWSRTARVLVNGAERNGLAPDDNGYIALNMTGDGDTVAELYLDVSPRLTIAHAKVEENDGEVCVEAGPLVYCAEACDSSCSLNEIWLKDSAEFRKIALDIAGERVIALTTEDALHIRGSAPETALYSTLAHCELSPATLRLIPYYAWDNRGFCEMRVWLKLRCG